MTQTMSITGIVNLRPSWLLKHAGVLCIRRLTGACCYYTPVLWHIGKYQTALALDLVSSFLGIILFATTWASHVGRFSSKVCTLGSMLIPRSRWRPASFAWQSCCASAAPRGCTTGSRSVSPPCPSPGSSLSLATLPLQDVARRSSRILQRHPASCQTWPAHSRSSPTTMRSRRQSSPSLRGQSAASLDNYSRRPSTRTTWSSATP